MGLNELDIKSEYRTLIHNITREFIIPVLDKAVMYERAVGFFSSSALSQIAVGIDALARNGGKIKLVASPILSEEDVNAIRKGYKDRNETIKSAVIKQLNIPKNYAEQQRLNLLANLIADRILDIKIAFTENKSQMGIYHEKLGIISDSEGNSIAFSGSMNESETALKLNYEAIDVFCSWKNQDELDRVAAKKKAFNSIWENVEPGVTIVHFPELKDEIIDKYKRSRVDYSNKTDVTFEDDLVACESITSDEKMLQMCGAHIPDTIQLHPYQNEAIDKWEEFNYCGIFDMATGTGKTFTGLGAVARLSEALRGKLAVIIVCPYQHLVEQWIEDIVKFNISPIVGYSASAQKDWKQKLEWAIRDQKLKVKNKDFFCFITTNATYSSDFVQLQLNKIKGDVLFVVDEAHNFGASYLSRLLNEKFKYRLALSATLERHNDPEGTAKLYNYFGEKCIEYTLERAIREKKLTRYKYYPVFVTLSSDELQEYTNLSREILKCLKKSDDGKMTLNDRGKKLALKRARLVAAAQNKEEVLRQEIQPYLHDNHILVYCGAASVRDYSKDYTDVNVDDLRQIDRITDLLGNELGMSVSQFTSKENIEERGVLKEQFAKGDTLQALIAIKCLDEGVNIPSIRTAFILASTTNPKEYIQRRGRVLRLSDGKEFAEIYDFITLPRGLNDVISLTEEEIKTDISLVRNELCRAFEFARLADNFVEANIKLDKIRDAYNLHEEEYVFEEDFNYAE